jgi:hypothetical protein
MHQKRMLPNIGLSDGMIHHQQILIKPEMLKGAIT